MNIAIFTHNYPKNKNDRKDAGIFVYDFVNELKKYHGAKNITYIYFVQIMEIIRNLAIGLFITH